MSTSTGCDATEPDQHKASTTEITTTNEIGKTAQPSKPETFEEFYQRFSNAANSNNWQQLIDSTCFPVVFYGQLDEEGELSVTETEFKNLTPDSIVGKQTWIALGVKQTTTSKEKTAGPAWYKIAHAEVGIKEIVRAEKHNKRILEYHSTTMPGAKTDAFICDLTM